MGRIEKGQDDSICSPEDERLVDRFTALAARGVVGVLRRVRRRRGGEGGVVGADTGGGAGFGRAGGEERVVAGSLFGTRVSNDWKLVLDNLGEFQV